MLDDRELLQRSDSAAFAVFYRRYERLVVGWLFRRCAVAEDAVDLAAETFAAAWLGRDRYRRQPDLDAGAWLLGIARNKLRMSLRRQRIERSAVDRLGLTRPTIDDATLRAVEGLFSDAERWLAGLPEDQQAAVRAHVLDEQRYDEIAARQQIQPAAARQRVSRGLARLRQTLSDEGVNP